MKKLFAFALCLLTFLLPPTLTACKEEFTLLDYVSVLTLDVYRAEYKGYTLTANYGYTEEPLILDGKRGKTTYYLTVTLPINEDNITYKIKLNDVDGEWNFKHDLHTATLKAKIPLSKHLFNFDATVVCESDQTTVNFTSIIPPNTLAPKDALKHLEKAQQTYVNSYMKDGIFTAEIILKLSVFKNSAYYYVAISDSDDNYKAMLINGATGELLAIRNVY